MIVFNDHLFGCQLWNCRLPFNAASVPSRCSALSAVNRHPYRVPIWRATFSAVTSFPEIPERDLKSDQLHGHEGFSASPSPLTLRSRLNRALVHHSSGPAQPWTD
jgi:hypothetical protein